MKVFHGLEQARGQLAGCAVTIGNFDGIHLGHRQLLALAQRLAGARGAPAVLLTFEPHPAKVLSPELAPPLITTLPRKLALLRALGLDAVILQPFDRAYASTTTEAFVRRDLIGALGAADVVVGYDFTFGKGRAGNPEVLATLGAPSLQVHTVPAYRENGLVVSSSKIRELLLEGRVEAASRLLGAPFVLDGTVAPGRGRGRTIGFPTANVAPATELVPANGVYTVLVAVEGVEGVLAGAANVGRKPTFGEEERTVEVHLLDFAGDLYGKRMAVAFLERQRPELRFESVDALVTQIERDVAEARRQVAAWKGPTPTLPPIDP